MHCLKFRLEIEYCIAGWVIVKEKSVQKYLQMF